MHCSLNNKYYNFTTCTTQLLHVTLHVYSTVLSICKLLSGNFKYKYIFSEYIIYIFMHMKSFLKACVYIFHTNIYSLLYIHYVDIYWEYNTQIINSYKHIYVYIYIKHILHIYIFSRVYSLGASDTFLHISINQSRLFHHKDIDIK